MARQVTHDEGPFRVEHGRRIYLAKFITGAGPNDTVVFVNGDPLDCRRENLKVVPGPRVARPGKGRGRR